jgi:sec-independent protein translocase protein TatA
MTTLATTLALLPNIGHQELLIILVIALILFGRRLPEVGRSLGKGIVEFKKGIKGIEDDIEDESDKKHKKAAARPPITDGGADPRVASTAQTSDSAPGPQA